MTFSCALFFYPFNKTSKIMIDFLSEIKSYKIVNGNNIILTINENDISPGINLKKFTLELLTKTRLSTVLSESTDKSSLVDIVKEKRRYGTYYIKLLNKVYTLYHFNCRVLPHQTERSHYSELQDFIISQKFEGQIPDELKDESKMISYVANFIDDVKKTTGLMQSGKELSIKARNPLLGYLQQSNLDCGLGKNFHKEKNLKVLSLGSKKVDYFPAKSTYEILEEYIFENANLCFTDHVRGAKKLLGGSDLSNNAIKKLVLRIRKSKGFFVN